MENRRIGAKGDETEDLIKYALLLGAGYFFVVKPILAEFGVDPADTATVVNQTTIDPTINPFSPLFSPGVAYVAKQLGSGSGLSSPQAFWDSVDNTYKTTLNPTLDGTFGYQDIAILAHEIYGDLSFFNFTDDIVNIFSGLPDQLTCSLIAQYFYYELGADLITKLQDGLLSFSWLKGGLPTSTIAAIINHINSLPVSTTTY